MAGVCCGKARKSKYCPDCGKQIDLDDPLVELLAHIYRITNQLENTLKKYLKSREEYDEHSYEEGLRQHTETIAKWKRWKVALEDSMKKLSEVN